MPSYAEMMYVKKDILYNFNIYIISISCDSASRHLLQVYYSLDKDVRQQLMLHNLLQLPNDDGQNRSDINSLIKNILKSSRVLLFDLEKQKADILSYKSNIFVNSNYSYA